MADQDSSLSATVLPVSPNRQCLLHANPSQIIPNYSDQLTDHKLDVGPIILDVTQTGWQGGLAVARKGHPVHLVEHQLAGGDLGCDLEDFCGL